MVATPHTYIAGLILRISHFVALVAGTSDSVTERAAEWTTDPFLKEQQPTNTRLRFQRVFAVDKLKLAGSLLSSSAFECAVNDVGGSAPKPRTAAVLELVVVSQLAVGRP